MAGSTPNLGLYLPGGGSTGTWTPDEVADIDPLNQNMQKIDTFAGTVGVQTSRNQQFYGPAGAISAIVGMKLGDTYQESDGSKILWRYDGSNWVTAEGGMFLIRPSVLVGTGVVQNVDGGIDVTASTTFSLTNVFSARFRRYRIDFWATFPGPAALQFCMRSAAGVDDTSANYVIQYWYNSAPSTISSSTAVGAAFPTAGSAVEREIGEVTIDSPFLVQSTGFATEVTGVVGTTAYTHFIHGVLGGTAQSYPSVTIKSSGGVFTGHFRVYGYA